MLTDLLIKSDLTDRFKNKDTVQYIHNIYKRVFIIK